MGPLLADTFGAYDCHVFVISVGAVVRMVAPLLVNKKVDPAVLCVDDAARFSICVLSGHVGRGNQYTERTAAILGATPVVTTASDAHESARVAERTGELRALLVSRGVGSLAAYEGRRRVEVPLDANG